MSFAIKNGKNAIADILSDLGAQDSKDMGLEKKKSKKKAMSQQGSENNDSKLENKLRKYVLVKIEDGEKKVLTSREIEEFRKTYPEVADLLYNQNVLEELEQNAPEQ